MDNKNIKNSIFDEKFSNDKNCNLEKCKSIYRLRQILHFYQTIQEGNDNNLEQIEIEKLIIEYIKSNKYNNIVNDYHHVLLIHLNVKSQEIISKNYNKINLTFNKLINCQISKCKFYQRNNRDRDNMYKVEGDNDDDYKHDKFGLTYCDILDNIHTYFIHAYDTGFRIKRDLYINNNDDDGELEEKLQEIEDVNN